LLSGCFDVDGEVCRNDQIESASSRTERIALLSGERTRSDDIQLTRREIGSILLIYFLFCLFICQTLILFESKDFAGALALLQKEESNFTEQRRWKEEVCASISFVWCLGCFDWSIDLFDRFDLQERFKLIRIVLINSPDWSDRADWFRMKWLMIWSIGRLSLQICFTRFILIFPSRLIRLKSIREIARCDLNVFDVRWQIVSLIDLLIDQWIWIAFDLDLIASRFHLIDSASAFLFFFFSLLVLFVWRIVAQVVAALLALNRTEEAMPVCWQLLDINSEGFKPKIFFCFFCF